MLVPLTTRQRCARSTPIIFDSSVCVMLRSSKSRLIGVSFKKFIFFDPECVLKCSSVDNTSKWKILSIYIFYMEEIVVTFQKNLDLLLKAKGIKKADLCRATGIATATMTRYGRGERKPTSAHLISICKFFDVTPEWLLTGEGSMRKADTVADRHREDPIMDDTSHTDTSSINQLMGGTGMYTIGDMVLWVMKNGTDQDREDLMMWKKRFIDSTSARIDEIKARHMAKKKTS